jgi:hypothetical protein
VNTYPLTERARGFLLGMGMVEDGAESEHAEDGESSQDSERSEEHNTGEDDET